MSKKAGKYDRNHERSTFREGMGGGKEEESVGSIEKDDSILRRKTLKYRRRLAYWICPECDGLSPRVVKPRMEIDPKTALALGVGSAIAESLTDYLESKEK